MNPSEDSVAFGGPGIEPRWTSSAKEGVGTAYHTSCRLWFTLSHGIINEIYYPHVDQPNSRDFQFLIADGRTFCHEEKRDLDHQIEYPERDCVFYRLTNSEPQGRYRLIKTRAYRSSDEGHVYRLSRCVLLAHEDKVFQGALVASMSIPWGETKGDNDLGGYHLVWTRDLAQSATALLATGQSATPLRALIWLAALQRPDGSFPQNSWIDGSAYWCGLQLDEVAAPILLAWQDDFYADCVSHPKVLRLLALSGGYSRQEGNERLRRNHGVVASFSRALVEGLTAQQSDAEYNALLDAAIQSIFEASTVKQDERTPTPMLRRMKHKDREKRL